jgi:hypothetical protein
MEFTRGLAMFKYVILFLVVNKCVGDGECVTEIHDPKIPNVLIFQ